MSGGPPKTVAVLGAGTMGAGISLAFARAGWAVIACTRTDQGARRAQGAIARAARQLADCGAEAPERITQITGQIRLTSGLRGLSKQASLVIESIPERLPDKRRLLAEAEAVVADRAIITSNTSSLPLGRLSSALRRPERFAGFHWFNPAELVRLVEIVPGPQTSPETVAVLQSWSASLGKRAVTLARDTQGFVANRLQYALLREAYALVEAGVCEPAEVDEAVRAGLGPRWAAVGPFESMDLAGLDVHLEVARQLFPVLSTASHPPRMLESLVRSGALGTKSGLGILGGYGEQDVAALTARRARLLTLISRAAVPSRPVAGTGPDRRLPLPGSGATAAGALLQPSMVQACSAFITRANTCSRHISAASCRRGLVPAVASRSTTQR
jgi:3-hydroxybutyryl-CoA dehydrogenase